MCVRSGRYSMHFEDADVHIDSYLVDLQRTHLLEARDKRRAIVMRDVWVASWAVRLAQSQACGLPVDRDRGSCVGRHLPANLDNQLRGIASTRIVERAPAPHTTSAQRLEHCQSHTALQLPWSPSNPAPPSPPPRASPFAASSPDDRCHRSCPQRAP
jgi:hypothetical protein